RVELKGGRSARCVNRDGLATKFVKAVSSRTRQRKDVDRFYDFVSRKRRREGSFDEVRDQNVARGRTANIDGCAERGKRERPIRCWIGVSQTAADGAAVAHRAIGNGRRDLAQHPAAGKPAASILPTGVGDAGTDVPRATGIFQLLQRLKPRDIDQ